MSDDGNRHLGGGAGKVGRRAVLGATAWAAPAIVVVTAAPALAASGATWSVATSATRSGRSADGSILAPTGANNASYMILDFTITRLAPPDLQDVTLTINLDSTGTGAQYRPELSTLDGFVYGGSTASGVKSFIFSRATAITSSATIKIVLGGGSGGAEQISNADTPASIVFGTATTGATPAQYAFTFTDGVNPAGGNVQTT